MLSSRHTVYTYKEKTTKKDVDRSKASFLQRTTLGVHDGAGRCDECRAAIGTGERDETREFTREVRVLVVVVVCTRKETDGEDAHARTRRPDSRTTK